MMIITKTAPKNNDNYNDGDKEKWEDWKIPLSNSTTNHHTTTDFPSSCCKGNPVDIWVSL